MHPGAVTDVNGIAPRPERIETFDDLLVELDRLRIAAARGRGKARLSLQDIATASGVPRSSLANYLSGVTLLPADQLDAIVRGLKATPEEAAAWERAWERAMEHRMARGADPQERLRLPATSSEPDRVDVNAAPPAQAPAPVRSHRRLAVVALTVVATAAGAYLVRRGPERSATPTGDPTPATRPGCQPVTGDWNADGMTTFGLACKHGINVSWVVTDGRSGAVPPASGMYGNADWCQPVTGDWDGDGTTRVGVACGGGPEHRIRWSLINEYSGSPSYPRFYFGDSDTCRPVTGDWNGDGSTTVGAACAEDGRIRWDLIDAHSEGARAYPPFVFGSADTCRPVTGDWDGDGRTGVGVACTDRTGTRWKLRNDPGSGAPWDTFVFGAACLPVTGDWNGDRRTSVATVCADGDNLAWTLTDTNPAGDSTTFPFGAPAPYVASTGWAGPNWPRQT